ncbi:unnamed protein product [Symbiodinium sp. CCMP2592]|nr:unnamed protein product [Symbiodinium sp. CCMP2592]
MIADDARRMEEYWAEKDAEEEAARQAARAAREWDDWATHSELSEPTAKEKRRRMTVTVAGDGPCSSTSSHQIPLPDGWVTVTLAIPPSAATPETQVWPPGALRPSTGNEGVALSQSQQADLGSGGPHDDGRGLEAWLSQPSPLPSLPEGDGEQGNGGD